MEVVADFRQKNGKIFDVECDFFALGASNSV
jgi:hypothetical protein